MKNYYFHAGIIFSFLLITACNSRPEGYHDPREKQKLLVYDEVIRVVKNSLKSPSTAQFPDLQERVIHVLHDVGNKYAVVSWVDSQNGYGAMIRTKFMIDATLIGDKVECSELTFLDGF